MTDLNTLLVRQARIERLVKFGILCNVIMDYKKRIPKSSIRRLKAYRAPFKAMLNDDYLGKVAENRLAVLDSLVEYAEAVNEGDEVKAAQYRKQSIAIHDEGDRYIETEVIKND